MTDGVTSTVDVIKTVIEKNFISLINIFHHFLLDLVKHIAIETVTNIYIFFHPARKVFISRKTYAFMEQHFHAG